MPELLSRKQVRLKDYDYSVGGAYFVTVCSMARQNIFSKIVGTGLAPVRYLNGQPQGLSLHAPVRLELTKIGQIIDNHWRDIPNQCDNVDIDEFIIMPNHIHGVLIINKQEGAKLRADARPAPTVSDIICAFKSKCTVEYVKYIKQNNLDISGKIWQRSFYDHIIRNERSLNVICEYIFNNPENWEEDIDNLMNP